MPPGPNCQEEWKHGRYLLEVSFIIFISQGRVEVDDQVSSALGQYRRRPVFGVLNILLDKRNTQHLHLLFLPSPRRRQALRDADMKQGIEFFKGTEFLCLAFSFNLAWIRNVERLGRIVKDGRPFFDTRGEVAVHTEDVICDHSVVFFIHVVRDDEKKIETREKGIRKCDVLVRVFVNVVLKIEIVRATWPMKRDSDAPVRRSGSLRQLHCTSR